jgi:hypothetical protein
MSNERCGDESCEVEYCEEEQDALGGVMELVKSLSTQLERLEYLKSAEDFPVHEVNVLVSSTEHDHEDHIVVEALHPAPDAPAIPRFDDYSDRNNRAPLHNLLIKGVVSLYMTTTNQIPS